MGAFDAHESVFRGFELLRRRLDPLIQTRIDALAPGVGWVRVLEEMDRLKGRSPGIYGPQDPSAQLRMLTERLGSLGFPFDEGVRPARYVSTLASDLRIARNNVAHGNPIDIHDAIRMHDSSTKLLGVLGDADGEREAAGLRDEAIVAAGEALTHADDVGPTEAAADEDGDASAADSATSEATPAPVSGENPLGADRLPWQQWRVTLIGGKEELENYKRRVVREKLHALVEEIVEFEGPLSLDRLVDLVRRSYGVGKLHTKRRAAVERQVRVSERVRVDRDGFVWPAELDVDRWRVFRPASGDASKRLLYEISPLEVANALDALQSDDPSLDGEALDRAVIEIFGGGRKVAAVAARLADAHRLRSSARE